MPPLVKFLHTAIAAIEPRYSVKARLGLTIGSITFLFSFLTSLTVNHTVTAQMKANTGESLAELAYQMTDKLDQGMFERYHDVEIMAALDSLGAPDKPAREKRALLEKLKASFAGYAWIGLANKQGKVMASTGGILEGRFVAERPWFQGARMSPYVGDVHQALLYLGIKNPCQRSLMP